MSILFCVFAKVFSFHITNALSILGFIAWNPPKNPFHSNVINHYHLNASDLCERWQFYNMVNVLNWNKPTWLGLEKDHG